MHGLAAKMFAGGNGRIDDGAAAQNARLIHRSLKRHNAGLVGCASLSANRRSFCKRLADAV
jgi:hypothetical protein